MRAPPGCNGVRDHTVAILSASYVVILRETGGNIGGRPLIHAYVFVPQHPFLNQGTHSVHTLAAAITGVDR